MKKNKNAFTLAETLITLTILGIVAAITIPSLINHYKEVSNRTKVKKAMATYEKALNQMVIDYDIKSDLALGNAFPLNDCSKTSEYFKIAEGSDCRFKTSDGIWWDISSIKKPIIILDKKFKDADWSDLRDGYAETSDGTHIYGMTGRIDDKGILRINDKKFEDNDEGQPNNQKCLAKLYSFVNNIEDLDLKYSKPCPNECDVMGALSGGGSGCSECSFEFNINEINATVLFDKNGNLYKANYTLPDEEYEGETITAKGVLNSDMTYTLTGYYLTGEKATVQNCPMLDINTLNCAEEFSCIKNYNKDGSLKSQSGDGCEN